MNKLTKCKNNNLTYSQNDNIIKIDIVKRRYMEKSNILRKRMFLVDARKAKGYSQTALGKIIGVSGNAITQYEQGKRFPKPETLIKICKELDLDIKLFYS